MEKWTEQQYREWILTLNDPQYTIVPQENRIQISCTGHHAEIIFYPENIIELTITNTAKDTAEFYLHFRLEEKKHAMDLTHQMLKTLLTLKNRKAIRAVLTCSSALTTSFFAEKLNEAAGLLGEDMSFQAVSIDRIYQEAADFDVVLLAPQVSFQYRKMREILKDKTVLKIPAGDFGRYRTGPVIELVKKEFLRKYDEAIPEEILPLKISFDNPYRILVVCMIHHNDGTRIGYRIYDHGQKTLDQEVIKPTLCEQDIYDLFDYVFSRHEEIDLIGISLPGVAYKGSINEPEHGFNHTNLAVRIRTRYQRQLVLFNDVNACALGYHAMHDDCDNMVFHFQPRGSAAGGAGIIVSGRLHLGHMHTAGEVGPLIQRMLPEVKDPVYSPDAALRAVTSSLLAYITVLAPEKIVVFSDLTPDMEEVKRELEKYVDAAYLPQLVHVGRLKRYMMAGTMIRCLEFLQTELGKSVRMHTGNADLQ